MSGVIGVLGSSIGREKEQIVRLQCLCGVREREQFNEEKRRGGSCLGLI